MSGPKYIDSLDMSRSRSTCPLGQSFYLFSDATLRRVGVIEDIHKYIQKQSTGTYLYKALTLNGKSPNLQSVIWFRLVHMYLSAHC